MISVDAASRIATAILTARSAGWGIGTGSLKNIMIPSPENWFERPLELADQRSQCAVILAQEIQNFLGLGGLGERGVATKIAEYDNDFTAMTLQNFFVALGDNHFGKLWREKSLRPSNPAQLLNLLRARLETAVQVGYDLGF